MPAVDPLRLKERMKRAGLSQREAAEALQWDPARLSRWLSGKMDRYTVNDVDAVTKLIEMAEGQLRHEQREEMMDAYASNDHGRAEVIRWEMDAPAPDLKRSRTIPVYGLVGASSPSGAIHLDHTAVIDHTPRHPAQGRRGEVFALEVWNESMSPRYEPGELVYCVRGRWPQRGKDCVVELKSGDAFLKQYQREADGVIFTRQHNPDDEVRFKTGDIRALHAVVGRG